MDCNATTPIDPAVEKEVIKYLGEEFGNAGSRTHDYGTRAKQAVQNARDRIAEVVKANRDEIIFTSGATESNNIAILGLAKYGEESGKKHIISTEIEHKAVLEPLDYLSKNSFQITLIPPNSGGFLEAEKVQKALRDDTLLVSVMHVNNETGVIQPITEIAERLKNHTAYFHVDAAQGFGKDIETLQNPHIDLISISGHKIYGPKGIGVLVTRKRGYKRAPLKPLMYGGGQERGLRPGTLPVHLIVGLGHASECAVKYYAARFHTCKTFKDKLLKGLDRVDHIINGDQEMVLPNALSVAFPGVDSEAVIVALKDKIAISNGSACTSQSYEPSHVLKAMNADDSVIQSTVRLSWCHMTEDVDWDEIVTIIKSLI
jgi:cysteine desulfurase